MANEEHLKILRQGVEVWNKWREENAKITHPDLSNADLSHLNLSGVDLRGANLNWTDLIKANLSKSNLSGTSFHKANLLAATLDGIISGDVSRFIWHEKGRKFFESLKTDFIGTLIADERTYRKRLKHSIVDFFGANLSKASLIDAKLNGANFNEADLTNARFLDAYLGGANFIGADLTKTSFLRVKMAGADLSRTKLNRAVLADVDADHANFSGANLRKANLQRARLRRGNLSKAILFQADLEKSDLSIANLTKADIRGANLSEAKLIGTNFKGADLTGCRIYGTAAWGLKLDGANQTNLIITNELEAEITVDNLEVAQFIYLLLNRKKLRNVIDTITSKSVLILGRFTPERKAVLDAMANELRKHNLLPIIFDFERASSRDFTETIKTLAGMSLFVIADITNPKSAPLELQATVPDYQIPFVPILEKGESPFSMLRDLLKYPWVLPLLEYKSSDDLIKSFKGAIIDEAFSKHKELLVQKAEKMKTRTTEDYLKDSE